jgi:hypothetical protein
MKNYDLVQFVRNIFANCKRRSHIIFLANKTTTLLIIRTNYKR